MAAVTNQPGIFGKLSTQTSETMKKLESNQTGFLLDFYREAVADPIAFANSCVDFATTKSQAEMLFITNVRMAAHALAATNPPEIVATLDRDLVTILKSISTDTVEKASVAFNSFLTHVDAGDLDSFRFFWHPNPATSEEVQQTIYHSLVMNYLLSGDEPAALRDRIIDILAEGGGSTSLKAQDGADLIKRVIPALILAIELVPVEQEAPAISQRISFVGEILRQNLAHIAQTAQQVL